MRQDGGRNSRLDRVGFRFWVAFTNYRRDSYTKSSSNGDRSTVSLFFFDNVGFIHTDKSRSESDVIYVKLLRKRTIVLNTIEAARDLLDKRSAKYSDRPSMILHSDMSVY